MCVQYVCVAFSNDKRILVAQFRWEETGRWYGDSPEGESGLFGTGVVVETWRCVRPAGGHCAVEAVWGLEGEGAAVAHSPQRDASTFRVAAGVEWGAMERARAQWRGHLGTLKLL